MHNYFTCIKCLEYVKLNYSQLLHTVTCVIYNAIPECLRNFTSVLRDSQSYESFFFRSGQRSHTSVTTVVSFFWFAFLTELWAFDIFFQFQV